MTGSTDGGDARRARLLRVLRSVGLTTDETHELVGARDLDVSAGEAAVTLQTALQRARQRLDEQRTRLDTVQRALLHAEARLDECAFCRHVTDRAQCRECPVMAWDVPPVLEALFLK